MSKIVRSLLVPVVLLGSLSVATSSTAVPSAAPAVMAVTPGALPFFATVEVGAFAPRAITSAGFSVVPRPGTVAEPVSASYSRAYLVSQGLLDVGGWTLSIPIFGLYADYTNTVELTVRVGRRALTIPVTITTSAWSDPMAGVYENPVRDVPRQPSARLSYSFFMLKSWATAAGPIIIDTDGYVRWVGNFGFGSIASNLWNNEVWVGQLGTGNVYAASLTGTAPRLVADLSVGPHFVTNFHHNMDLTSKGMLVDVDTTTSIEAVVVVMDAAGNVTKTFDMGQILGDYLIAHGEDPSGWVDPGIDWFHNNAATYWPAKNQLVVSSRENFVIGIDYDTSEISWILGDTTKEWYVNYPSLRPLALTLRPGTLEPIGQHAVSIDAAGNLMLFNNGLYGFFTDPGGQFRGYSLAASYAIDLRRMTARMVWSFDHGQDIWSPICSSIYQDGSNSMLVNFASSPGGVRVMGLTSKRSNEIAFDYTYPWDVSAGWNAMIVHLERVRF